MPANSREEWDRIFARLEGDPGGEDAWLERWRDLILRSNRSAPILDLGCGAGEDALLLSRWGFGVVAADFSEKALGLASRRAPEAETRHVDITEGLPFPDAHFGAIVASLSLHYFPWSETVEVLEDVGRCLVPGGHLLARLNSTNDPHYAAARKKEIEPNFYLIDGSRSASSTATTSSRCSARPGRWWTRSKGPRTATGTKRRCGRSWPGNLLAEGSRKPTPRAR